MFTYKTILLILFAYLLGSVPFAFLFGRWIMGIDIRRYGSGTVSGSMIFEHTHHWLVVPVGLLDIAKAALPTWLGLQWGLGEMGVAATGLAAIIGHNWPVYLNFTGGRGFSPIIGVFLVLFPWGDVWLFAFLATGYVLKDSAPWALASVISMPLVIWWMNGPGSLYWLLGAMVVVILVKRLEANRRPLPKRGKERNDIIWMRLIFDRDIMDHNAWIHRRI